MKSSFESKKHREVRRTKEALRAHVITGRIPERVIGILIDHGCTRSSALVLMENIFTGELTVTQRGIIREISKKSPGTIPPVTPPTKTRRTKARGTNGTSSFFEKHSARSSCEYALLWWG
jgi:hypothetical protein